MNTFTDISNTPPKSYRLQPCSHTSLARAYGISRKTLYKRLARHCAGLGLRQGYRYSLSQLFYIITQLGWPPNQLDVKG